MERIGRLSCAALLLAAAGGATAYAQVRANGIWDQTQLPETQGTIKQYTLTPRGDVDGLILTDGTQVQLPPHLSSETVFVVRPGDQVKIKGLKAKSLPMIDAATVTNVATGASVTDNGPPAARPTDLTTTTGKVALQLHGKRGEVNGAVFEDGTILRLPPPEAVRLADMLQVGREITVRGERMNTSLGTWIEARAIGENESRMTDLQAPPRPPKGPADRPPPPPRR